MGMATDKAPARSTETQPYSLWEIDVRMFDAHFRQVDTFTCRQELFITPDSFLLRLTRLTGSSKGAQYQAQGTVKDGEIVDGSSGFGGALKGGLLANGGVFLEGSGGDADFILTATPTGPDHQRCFRRFVAHGPTALWGTDVTAGTYFATTEDQWISSAAEAPAALLEPLPG